MHSLQKNRWFAIQVAAAKALPGEMSCRICTMTKKLPPEGTASRSCPPGGIFLAHETPPQPGDAFFGGSPGGVPPGEIVSELIVKVNDILALVYSKVRLPQVPTRQHKPSGGRDVQFILYATTVVLEGL